LRAFIGIPVTNRSKLLAGITTGRFKDEYYQTNNFISTDISDITNFMFYSPYVFYEYNTLNRKLYPTEGMRFKASFRHIWGEEEYLPGINKNIPTVVGDYSKKHAYYQVNGVFESYITYFHGWRVGIYGEIYLSNRPFYSNYTSSILAAHQFQPTLESSLMFLPNYRANNYAAFGLSSITNIYKSIDLRLEAYVFQSQNLIRQNAETQLAHYTEPYSNRAYIASASLILNSPIGPVSVTANYYSDYKESFTFMFNAGFYIFGKWALD